MIGNVFISPCQLSIDKTLSISAKPFICGRDVYEKRLL